MSLSELIRRLKKLAYQSRRNARLAKTYESKLRCEGRAAAYETAVDWLTVFRDDSRVERDS